MLFLPWLRASKGINCHPLAVCSCRPRNIQSSEPGHGESLAMLCTCMRAFGEPPWLSSPSDSSACHAGLPVGYLDGAVNIPIV